MKCQHCGKNQISHDRVVFMHREMSFSINTKGISCPECAKELFLEKFDVYPELIGRKASQIVVNWQFYVEALKARGSGDKVDDLNEILLALGIFSYCSKGNWEIVDGQLILNPSRNFFVLFFTRQVDGCAYAHLTLSASKHQWQIRSVNKVIEGTAVCD